MGRQRGYRELELFKVGLEHFGQGQRRRATKRIADCSSGGMFHRLEATVPALGGHAWPGGLQYLPVPIIGTTSTDISATGLIWNFAKAYHV